MVFRRFRPKLPYLLVWRIGAYGSSVRGFFDGSVDGEAVKFLEELLKDGPVGSKAVLDAAQQAGIARRTIVSL